MEQQRAPAKANLEYKAKPLSFSGVLAATFEMAASTFAEPVDDVGDAIVLYVYANEGIRGVSGDEKDRGSLGRRDCFQWMKLGRIRKSFNNLASTFKILALTAFRKVSEVCAKTVLGRAAQRIKLARFHNKTARMIAIYLGFYPQVYLHLQSFCYTINHGEGAEIIWHNAQVRNSLVNGAKTSSHHLDGISHISMAGFLDYFPPSAMVSV
jgi:hypothetical protein